VLVLHYGKELAFGSPVQVLSDPAVVEAYIGKH
jgi:ABC-type branched-subunit amino acid transport system ATPase component